MTLRHMHLLLWLSVLRSKAESLIPLLAWWLSCNISVIKLPLHSTYKLVNWSSYVLEKKKEGRKRKQTCYEARRDNLDLSLICSILGKLGGELCSYQWRFCQKSTRAKASTVDIVLRIIRYPLKVGQWVLRDVSKGESREW